MICGCTGYGLTDQRGASRGMELTWTAGVQDDGEVVGERTVARLGMRDELLVP